MKTAVLIALLPLAACAADGGDYPSLAPRAVEGRGFAEPEAPTPAPPTADPALDATIGAARASLAGSASRFTTQAAAAERAVRAARGAAQGSDAWLDAQTAVAALDTLRADTSQATNDLAALAIDRAAKLEPAYPTLDAAQAEAERQGQAQSARIDALAAALR